MKFKLPHWLALLFGALSPSLIAMSSSLPANWQGPVSVMGIGLAGLAGLTMPAPSWVSLAHPIIPTGMIGAATMADAMLKQWADGQQGLAKVGLYAGACVLAWAAGLHAPSPVQDDQASPAAPQAVKTAALALAAMTLGLLPTTAMAQSQGGFDWSMGPTVPFLEYDFGAPNRVSVAPGAGVQVSITHDVFKREIFGKSWDMLDLDLMAFGSVVASSSGQFGTFSGAAAVCTLSSLLCLGAGKHILAPDGAFSGGGWFAVVALSVNFGLSPTSPPVGAVEGPPGLVRGNHLFFGEP